MFSQFPKKIAGQLAQYSPIAALTMIVGHGTDRAFAAQMAPSDEPADGGPADHGLGGDGVSRLASLTGASCVEPTLAARPAVAPAAPPPPQVIHEIVKEVPVPVPGPGAPPKVLVQPERHEYHTVKVTNIDNHPTTVSTTVNQHITAGGDVDTSVNTNTVSGKGALGITGAEDVDADGGPARAGSAPTGKDVDEDFGTGAKPDRGDAAPGNGGTSTAEASAEGGDGTSDGQAPATDAGGLSPAGAPDEPAQPQPELHEVPPADADDPDGPPDEPQDSLAKAVHGGADDPLAPTLVGGPDETLPHEPPPDAGGDPLGHAVDTPDHHVDPATDHDSGPDTHDDLVI